ncbi:MAG: hypothetical protein ACYC4U_18905, partial [Pirellulaceae bacterium]
DKVVAQRIKDLEQACADTGKLVAYLNCGSQIKSTPSDGVQLTWVPSQVYLFPSQEAGIPATQASVAYDTTRVVFEITGLDPQRHYDVGLTWWDYDNGQRTQMVTVGSPGHRQVHMAIPAIRLPNFKEAGQKPAEKRFSLPVRLARDGKMQLIVHQVTGANVVISELWIVQRKD